MQSRIALLVMLGMLPGQVARASPPADATAAWIVESNQPGADFGFCVASAGDVNGDGFADVAVGAYAYDDGVMDAGAAFVYHGSAAGPGTIEAWRDTGDATIWFGGSVASAGDVNGDGFDDLIVGAVFYDGGATDEGQAWVYLGSPAGLATDAVWAAGSGQAGAVFGFAVASAGDVNGDGFDDVLVGAPYYDDGATRGGRVYLYLGSPAGPDPAPAWVVEADPYWSWFGRSVASAGDVNGDGFDDVLIGAPLFDAGLTNNGKAYLYLGSPTGPPLTPQWTAEGDQDEAFFGYVVASAGDVDGDGFDDIVISAPYRDTHVEDAGRAYVYLGSPEGPAAAPDWIAEPPSPSPNDLTKFGASVAGAGDWDGDGFDDVVVGAPFDEESALPHDNEGTVFVYAGSAAGLSTSAVWTQRGGTVGQFFGTSVASAGDVNADGYADLLVGGPNFHNAEGRAYLFSGTCSAVPDADGDGVGDACDQCPGASDGLDTDGDGTIAPCDCDDADPATYPGAPELCDGVDNSCAGVVLDEELDADGDGVRTCDGDCDDADPTRSPNAVETCNGVDDRCVGTVLADEADLDGDGAPVCMGDCDDEDADVHPAALEVCGDGIDNNCDGASEACGAEEADAECGCSSGVPPYHHAPAWVLLALLAARRRQNSGS